jgi:4-amino-4-deoxy-L-arabinose transferase-like glycosyltransferase
MVCRLAPVLSDIARRFNRWRLAFLLFLVVYALLLLLYLGYAPIRWDETPHLYGGLLLNRGQFDDYLRESAFYPPLFDAVTAFFFKILGSSVFSGRLVAVTFGILSIWTLFEFTYKFYGSRNAFISSVLLASMPGFIILCRLALIETMLLFFFSISLFLFFSWLRTNNNKMLILSGITLGLGFLVKYQILVAAIIMFVSIFFFGREHLTRRLGKFLLLLLIAGVVIAPWLLITYQKYSSWMFDKWLYVLGVGNEERLAYSTRFPTPIFYLVEMTQPYPHIHPIYLLVYILALLGLGLWLWRRNERDKFSLLSFAVIYIVFTLITSKDWRYITLVFPILAISGSDLILFLWDKGRKKLTAPFLSSRRKILTKIAVVGLVLLVGTSIIYSSYEVYRWVKIDHVNIPIKEASRYVVERSTLNETIVVLCAGNYFSADMVEFYLLVYNPDQKQPMQYPELPVDAYKPLFNVTWLTESSKAWNVKYLLLFEHGNITFFQSDLTSPDVLEAMLDSGNFIKETEFGSFPRRIFILRFAQSLE